MASKYSIVITTLYFLILSDEKSKAKLNEVLNKIAEESLAKYNIMKDEVNKLKPNDNDMNAKSKEKVVPQNQRPPTAMLDKKGNLLTSETAIQNRALEVFASKGMQKRP